MTCACGRAAVTTDGKCWTCSHHPGAPSITVLPASVPSFSPQIGESGRSTGTTMHAPLRMCKRECGNLARLDDGTCGRVGCLNATHAPLPNDGRFATATAPPGAHAVTIARELREAQEALREERAHSDALASVLNACRHYLPSARFKVKGEPRRRADAALKAHIERRAK